MGMRKARETLAPQEAREVAILDDIAIELVRTLWAPQAKQTRILKDLPFPVIDIETSNLKSKPEVFREGLEKLFYKRLAQSDWPVHEEIQSWLLDTWTSTVFSPFLTIGLDPILGVPVAFTKAPLPKKPRLEGGEGLSLTLGAEKYVDEFGIDYSYITWERTPIVTVGPLRLVRISCASSSNIKWFTARAGSSYYVHPLPDGADLQVLRPGRVVTAGEQLRTWFGPSYDDDCTCGIHKVQAPEEPSPVSPPQVERSPSPAPVLLRRESGESSRPKRPSPPKRDSLSARRLAARRVMSASPTPSEVATPPPEQHASTSQPLKYSPPSPPASSSQLGSSSEPGRSVSPVTSTDVADEPQPTFDTPLDAEEYPSFEAPAVEHDRQPSIEACLESLEAQKASSPSVAAEAFAEVVEPEAVSAPAEPAPAAPVPDSVTASPREVEDEPSEVIVTQRQRPVSVTPVDGHLAVQELPLPEAPESPKRVIEEVEAAPVSVETNVAPIQDSAEEVVDLAPTLQDPVSSEPEPEPHHEGVDVRPAQEPAPAPSPSPRSVVEPPSGSTVCETPVSESTSYEEPQVFEPPHASMKLEFLLAPVDEPIRIPETPRQVQVDVGPQLSPSVPSVRMEATPSPHHSDTDSVDMDVDDEWDAPTPAAMQTGPEPGSSGGTPLITPDLEAEHTGFPTTDDYGPVNAYLEADNGDDYTPLGTPLADETEAVVTPTMKPPRALRSSGRNSRWINAMESSVAEFTKHTLAARAALRNEAVEDPIGNHVPPPNRVILVDSYNPDESAERFRFHPSLKVSTDKFYSRIKRLQDQSTDLIVTWEYDLGFKRYGPYRS